MSLGREVYKSKWMWVLTGTVLGVGLTGGLSYRQYRAQVAQISSPGVSCENGIGAAKGHAGSAATSGPFVTSTAAATPTAWTPKINDRKLPGPAPEGMTWIPGGQF